MKLITTVREMERYARHNLRRGRRIALVPTMGCFHFGHVMLMRAARRRCDRLVVSIFVNPLQFGRGEDFASYPRNMRRDLATARAERVNAVFAPSSDELYPAGFSTFVEEERLSRRLCGPGRPGHFRGVTTVVAKLLQIVRPHTAVFGRKDAQQAAIVRKMILDLHFPVRLLVVPTVREKNGLAMSSRNEYLSARERREAAVLYAALEEARALVRAGERDAAKVAAAARDRIAACPVASVEYVEAVHPETLEPVGRITGPTLLALAARVGPARLIDNVILHPRRRG
ncbi:MAG: pantoate--beta-alanine ligase [bacterium]|nr:pantoate--beta-alanine ligase [bacterium]